MPLNAHTMSSILINLIIKVISLIGRQPDESFIVGGAREEA